MTAHSTPIPPICEMCLMHSAVFCLREAMDASVKIVQVCRVCCQYRTILWERYACNVSVHPMQD